MPWDAKKIYCPKCGAKPGCPCNTSDGGPHWYRVAAAREISKMKKIMKEGDQPICLRNGA